MKTFCFIFIAAMAFVFTGCGSSANKVNEGASRDQGMVDDKLAAQTVLVSFFDDLSNGRYEEAAAKFIPDDDEVWDWLNEYGESRADALKNYCSAVGTCLPVNVISSETENDDFIFKVNFSDPNGNVFVLGPCCGATEDEMPPISEFDYQVRKLGGDYIVFTLPQYVP